MHSGRTAFYGDKDQALPSDSFLVDRTPKLCPHRLLRRQGPDIPLRLFLERSPAARSHDPSLCEGLDKRRCDSFLERFFAATTPAAPFAATTPSAPSTARRPTHHPLRALYRAPPLPLGPFRCQGKVGRQTGERLSLIEKQKAEKEKKKGQPCQAPNLPEYARGRRCARARWPVVVPSSGMPKWTSVVCVSVLRSAGFSTFFPLRRISPRVSSRFSFCGS